MLIVGDVAKGQKQKLSFVTNVQHLTRGLGRR